MNGVTSMTLHVQGQVVRARKGPLAQLTLEGLLSRVFAVMASQFVRSSEFPRAPLPSAGVRLLTCRKRPKLIRWQRQQGSATVSPDSSIRRRGRCDNFERSRVARVQLEKGHNRVVQVVVVEVAVIHSVH